MTTRISHRPSIIIEEEDAKEAQPNQTAQKTEQASHRTLHHAHQPPIEELITHQAEPTIQGMGAISKHVLENAHMHGAAHAAEAGAAVLVGGLDTANRIRLGEPVKEAVKKGGAKGAADYILSSTLGTPYVIIAGELRALSHLIPDFDVPANVILEDLNCDAPIPMGHIIRSWMNLPARVGDFVEAQIERIGGSALVQKHLPALVFNPLGMAYLRQQMAPSAPPKPLPERVIFIPPFALAPFDLAGPGNARFLPNSTLPRSPLSLPAPVFSEIDRPLQQPSVDFSGIISAPNTTLYNPNTFSDPHPIYRHVSLGVLPDPKDVFRIDLNIPLPLFIPSGDPWSIAINIGAGIYYLFKMRSEQKAIERAEEFGEELSERIQIYNEEQEGVKQRYQSLTDLLQRAPQPPGSQSPNYSEDLIRYQNSRISHLQQVGRQLEATIREEREMVRAGQEVHELTCNSQRKEIKEKGFSDNVDFSQLKEINEGVKKTYLDRQNIDIPRLESALRAVREEKAALERSLPAIGLRAGLEDLPELVTDFQRLDSQLHQPAQGTDSHSMAWCLFKSTGDEIKAFIRAYEKLPPDQQFLGEAGLARLKSQEAFVDQRVEQTRFDLDSLDENRAQLAQMKASQSPDLPLQMISFAKKLGQAGLFQEAVNVLGDLIQHPEHEQAEWFAEARQLHQKVTSHLQASHLQADYEAIRGADRPFFGWEEEIYQGIQEEGFGAPLSSRAWQNYQRAVSSLKEFIQKYEALPPELRFLEEEGLASLKNEAAFLEQRMAHIQFYADSLDENRVQLAQMSASQSADLPLRIISFARKLGQSGQFPEASRWLEDLIRNPENQKANWISEATDLFGNISYRQAAHLIEAQQPKACAEYIQKWLDSLPEGVKADHVINMASLQAVASLQSRDADPRPMIKAIDKLLSTDSVPAEERKTLSQSQADLRAILEGNISEVHDRYRAVNLFGELAELAFSHYNWPRAKVFAHILRQPPLLRMLIPHLISSPYLDELIERLSKADTWANYLTIFAPIPWAAHSYFQSHVSREKHPTLRWIGQRATLIPPALFAGANLLAFRNQINQPKVDNKGLALGTISSLSSAASFLDQALITTGTLPQGIEGMLTNPSLRAAYRTFHSRSVSEGLALANIVYNYGDLGLKWLKVSPVISSQITQYATGVMAVFLGLLGCKSYQNSRRDVHLEEMERHLDKDRMEEAWGSLYKSGERKSELLHETYLSLLEQLKEVPISPQRDALDLAAPLPSPSKLSKKMKAAVGKLKEKELHQPANRLNLELIELYIQAGNYKDAEAQLEHVPSMHAHHIRAKIAQKKANENPKEAIDYFKKAIDHLQQAHKGLRELREKDLPQAQLDHLSTELKKVEKEIELTRLQLIQAHIFKKEYNQAKALLPLVNHPESFIYQARFAREEGDLVKAISLLQKAKQAYSLQQADQDKVFENKEKRLREEMQKVQKTSHKAGSKNSSSLLSQPENLMQLGKTAHEEGNLAEAIAYFRRAKNIYSTQHKKKLQALDNDIQKLQQLEQLMRAAHPSRSIAQH